MSDDRVVTLINPEGCGGKRSGLISESFLHFFPKGEIDRKVHIKMLFVSKPTFEPETHRTLTALVEYISSDGMAIGE